MNRRSFLMLAGAGTALIAIPGLSYMSVSYAEAARGLILNELDYLKLDEAGINQFVQDYTTDKTDNYRIKIRSLYLINAKADQYQVVDELVKDYLLSTDFFRNKMNERKAVKYQGLYNPYKMPCANPFSSIYYPPQVS